MNTPGLLRGSPQKEVRLQVCELPVRNFALSLSVSVSVFVVGVDVVGVHEAERQELVRALVVPRVPHYGLLRHADDVAGRHDAAVGEGKLFKDLTLNGDCVSGRVSLMAVQVSRRDKGGGLGSLRESRGSCRAASRRKLSISGTFL